MNIAEKFAQKKELEEKNAETLRQEKVRALAKRIIAAFKDPEVIESMENYLVENGSISIEDFGCLCQKSFCDWQVGLDGLLQPLYKEWAEKGVTVRPSLKLDFYVPGGLSFYRRETTLEKLKEWNKSRK
jgi:hypothetical protein